MSGVSDLAKYLSERQAKQSAELAPDWHASVLSCFGTVDASIARATVLSISPAKVCAYTRSTIDGEPYPKRLLTVTTSASVAIRAGASAGGAESEILYSEETCAPFSATERFISGTRIRSANVIAAKIQKVSK
jgi:hypothetical protein